MSYSEKLKYVGNKKQLFSVKNYTMNDGKANGTRACDIDNGKGLFFTVIPDRCCDISELKLKGDNLCFQTAAGVVNPAYYDNRGTEFLRSFFAGFLTTCGLTTICSPCNDNGEDLGLHGRISNTPADSFSAWINENTVPSAEYANEEPEIILKGIMKEARLFGDKLTLEREIKVSTETNKFEIFDTVKNIGFKTSPHMILYHFNYGYPLLDENVIINVPAEKTVARDDFAAQDLAVWDKFPAPIKDREEQCYYHTLKKDADGYTGYSIFNPNLKKGVRITYDAKPLDYFIQWKMPGMGDYVLGLEPGNCHGEGRKTAREEGTLKFIEPQKEIKYHFIIELYEE